MFENRFTAGFKTIDPPCSPRWEHPPPTHTHKETVTRKKFYGHMDVSQQLTCDRRGIRSCVHWIKNAVGSLWSCCCIFCLPPSPQVIGNHYHYYCTNHSVQSTYHSWRVSHDIISTTITSRVIMFLVQLDPPAHDPGLHILDTHISLLCIIRICIMSLFIFCDALQSGQSVFHWTYFVKNNRQSYAFVSEKRYIYIYRELWSDAIKTHFWHLHMEKSDIYNQNSSSF